MPRSTVAVLFLVAAVAFGATAAVFGLQQTTRPASPPAADTADPEPDFGEMKQYWFGLIRRGPLARSEVNPEVLELQKAHLANIRRLAKEKKLVLAGPFADDGELRGIFVFDVETREEAERLVATDPAVKAGRLRVELHPWWATSKLTEIGGR